MEFNKIAGAILTAAVLLVAISFIGDALVRPKKHGAATVTVAARTQPAAPKEEKSLPPIAPLLASADAGAGAKVAHKCKACHDLTNAKKNKIGPHLWDVVLADKAHVDGFSYSSALKEAGGKWTYEDLNRFLANPKGFVKGTKMTFAGVKNDKERADLIAFLRGLSDAPKPLP